jgi:hypothetical protein
MTDQNISDVRSETIIYGGEEWVSLADHKRLHAALDEAVRIMKDARGHYGIEETGGPGQPATEWDEIADRMQMFVLSFDITAEGDR